MLSIVFSALISVFCVFDAVTAKRVDIGNCLLHFPAQKCSKSATHLYLFTSDQPNSPILLDPDNLRLPDFVSLNRTNKLLIHGYGGDLEFFATKLIRNAYLALQDVNVFVVDWGDLAPLPCYPTAAYNTKYVGKCTADLLLRYAQQYPEFKPYEMHGIGFSLGAHLVSFVSNRILFQTGRKLSRITGLDPALPFFASTNRRWKLDSSDADFVDVIHTNAGIFGKIEPSGHLDFYVNGGQIQPPCHHHRNVPLCSHIFSTIYFAESLHSDVGFWGIPCHSYVQFMFGQCSVRSAYLTVERTLMGEYSYPQKKSSIIFVETNPSPPYAIGLL